MIVKIIRFTVVSFSFLALAVLTESADAQQHFGFPGIQFSSGPGTEMTKMINRLGLGSNCGRCKALAAQMDANGPQWVRNNFNHVVSRTVNNAEQLGHRMGPIRRTGVRSLVRRSIRRSN